MKILSIGNSFSQDAQRYINRLAKHHGINIKTVNLYIGGCTLRTHYLNMLEDEKAYTFEFNGESTNIKVSIKQALLSDEWDYVTVQQASGKSAKLESYSPYVERLVEYIKKYCPHTKILIHETWAYENDSAKLKNAGFETSTDMHKAVKATYTRVAKMICADGIIPSGDTVQNAFERGLNKYHRDTFHASLGVGRYLLALVWLRYLTGISLLEDDFCDLDEPITDEEREIARLAANDVKPI